MNSRFLNAAPTATNLSAAETYTEDTPRNLVDIVVSDTDSATTTVVLTLSNAAAGSLNTGTAGAVTSTYNAISGVWTASGAIASVNTLLAALTFTPKANFNGSFSIATRVSDGIAPPVTGSKIFTGMAVNDAPIGTVVITGTPTQNQTLTASNTLADMDGVGTITYQWKAAGVVIAGATGSTLVLGAAQVGKAISVSASYTDGGGNLTSLSSANTAAVMGAYVGTAGADTLSGTTGAEQLAGLAGNDTYVVNNVGDVVVENLNQGTDLVQSSVTYTLAANVENLTLTGTTAINATGNALDNVLTGNSAANVLTGGAGNDTYVVGTGDTTIEVAGGGIDTVQSAITWTLASEVENLTLTGTTAINGTGNALNNILTGNSAANTLSGGAGADTMMGGAGNDTYVVDNVADVVTESLNEGTDLVQSSVSYTLGANVENLTLTGTTSINGTGNSLNNALTGNSGNNVLDGGAGADTMAGGAGNDTYYVDNAADVTTEAANAGTDTVISSINWTLATNLENLTLSGTGNINATGNTVANVLTGNAGANVLNGGAGADTMAGGLGNDTYVVGTGDTTIEAVGAGTDTVQSTITWTLATNVENLTLTGSAAVNSTGNTDNNVLTGNSAANTLTGGAGNDTLDGKAGADALVGGTGNDTYRLGRGYGVDTIAENDATVGNTDVALFDAGIAIDQLWFTKTGNNLDVSIIGTTDKFTVSNWYLGNQYRVEQFKTSDGKTLLDSQVQNLVQAMASFAPPPVGQTTLNTAQQTALAPVIAANWQ